MRGKLEADYSPEQIVGHAARRGIECIYQFVWQDKKRGRQALRLYAHQWQAIRQKGQCEGKRGQIVGRVDIQHRPAVVEEKQRVGDLEMDLVIGRGHSGVLKMAVLESK